MVDVWWSLLGAAIPAVIAGQAFRMKKKHAEEQRMKNARGREKSSDDIFVCERVCTSNRMLKKVGAFSKDPIPDTCVTVCGVSELDTCSDACARTVCVNQHQEKPSPGSLEEENKMLCSREIFKFLVRKDVRKILKRKDSDAGERGNCADFVSIGVAIATVTDLQFSLFGACVAMAWIIPSAINKILWSNLQQQENWTALSLMWKTTPITLLFLVSMIPFLDPPGVLSFHWSFNNTSAILLSAFLGFLLQWSGALALGATSAISHVVLGQFKTCVLLLGSYYLFGSNPGTTSICGAFIAIGGMSFFTYLNLNAKKQPAPLKVSSSLPKSKFSEDNGENRHGIGTDSV